MRLLSLLSRALDFYRQGHIKPIVPCKVFAATQIEEAFRYLQKGQHIGKVVVSMAEDSRPLRVTQPRSHIKLRQDRTYLFIGGLGGLGRSVATLLVEHGARHLAFFSRSAGETPMDDPFIKELESQNVSVQLYSGSVYNETDVQNTIQSLPLPVGGVLQASMVLEVSLCLYE